MSSAQYPTAQPIGAQYPTTQPTLVQSTPTAGQQTRDTAATAQSKARDTAANAQTKARDTAASAQAKVQSHPAYLQAKDKTNYYMNQLDKELTKYPVLNNAEQRTNVPKTYLVLGGAALVALLHSVNALAQPVSNFVGWGLPAYLSLKAIESTGTEDDRQWLTYWVVFGFMNLLESFALRLVLYYFSWYFAFKSVFILWLQLPAFRGAETIYNSALQPFLANISHAKKERSVARAPAFSDRAAPAPFHDPAVPATHFE